MRLKECYNPPMQRGFTLVELSIVLVILGLLVGGILAGRSLIKAGELRAIGQEYSKYRTATFAFKDKYFQPPGDLSNATQFWGVAAGDGSDATCRAFESTGTETCNGNGNGLVEQTNPHREHLRFWQHLANAGLIDGKYTGALSSTATDNANVTPNNHPLSKYPKGMWTTRAYNVSAGNGQLPDGNYNVNHFEYGAYNVSHANNWPSLRELLTPEDTWNVDVKLDDGMPLTGKVIGRSPNGWNNGSGTLNTCTLAQNSTDINANYALTVTTRQCTLYFMAGF